MRSEFTCKCFCKCELVQAVDSTILDSLSEYSADIRVLVETEDEYDRRGQFTRLFPSPFSSAYLRFFDKIRYNDLLLDEWTTQYFHIRNTGQLFLCLAGCIEMVQ